MTRNSRAPCVGSSFNPSCCIAVKTGGPLESEAASARRARSPPGRNLGVTSLIANSRWISNFPVLPVLSMTGRSKTRLSNWENSVRVDPCASTAGFLNPTLTLQYSWPGASAGLGTVNGIGVQLPSVNGFNFETLGARVSELHQDFSRFAMNLELKPVLEKRLQHGSLHHFLFRITLRSCVDIVELGIDPGWASRDRDNPRPMGMSICEPDIRPLDEAQVIGAYQS